MKKIPQIAFIWLGIIVIILLLIAINSIQIV